MSVAAENINMLGYLISQSSHDIAKKIIEPKFASEHVRWFVKLAQTQYYDSFDSKKNTIIVQVIILESRHYYDCCETISI